MALPDSLKRVPVTTINDRFIFADATDWPAGSSDAVWGDKESDASIDLTGLAAGAARQSSKATLPANMELEYDVWVGIEFEATDAAPVSGETVDFYYGLSPSATAGTANPGGLSGTDTAYTGTAGDSLDDSLKQLEHLGSLVVTADEALVQIQQIGIVSGFSLPEIMVVVDNNTSSALESDANEMFIAFIPREVQIQDGVTT